MSTKLVNIRIREISAVDRPANRRRFLIIKGDSDLGKVQPMTTEQALEAINKQFGGDYWAYRESTLKDPPLPEPQVVEKSEKELTVERLQNLAKAQGLPLEAYLREHPALYEQYKRLA